MYITLLNNYTRKYIYLRLNLLVYFFPPSLYLFTFLSYLSINNLATNIQLRIFSRRDNDKISRIATTLRAKKEESRGCEVMIISVRSGLGTRKSKRERVSADFAKVIRTNDVSNRRESIRERF